MEGDDADGCQHRPFSLPRSPPCVHPADRSPDTRNHDRPIGCSRRVSPYLRHDGPIRTDPRDSRRLILDVRWCRHWGVGFRRPRTAGFHRRAQSRARRPSAARPGVHHRTRFCCVGMDGSGLHSDRRGSARSTVGARGVSRRPGVRTDGLSPQAPGAAALMRLMVSLRAPSSGGAVGAREECSFLFVVEGGGRAWPPPRRGMPRSG
jgi:hypothetical protein